MTEGLTELVLIANAGDASVATFRLTADGLERLADSPMGGKCSTFAVDADRDLVYASVAGENPGVAVFALDRESGRLEPLAHHPADPMAYLALTGDGAVDRNGEAVADPGYDFSWTFTVTPTPAGCRLLTRERYRARTGPARVMTNLGVRLSTIMSEGMLRGIRDRAQRAGSAGGIGRRSTILT